jgi:hypothetical protein
MDTEQATALTNVEEPNRPEAPVAADGLESRVRTVYEDLSVKQQDWVRLSKLREALGNPDDVEMRRVLLAMIRTGRVHLAPSSNRKGLTDADRAAAIRIGGEDKHLIAIEPPADDLRPSERGASPRDHTEQAPNNLDTRLRTAYAQLAAEPNAWVALARLRPLFHDVPRVDLDAALRQLSRADDASIAPEENQKTLTAADHAAAIRLGHQDKHLLSIWTG